MFTSAPMQNTEFSLIVKIEIFHLKIFDISQILDQNIDCE